ncbi:hypothetical protein ACGFIP_22825 [Micromonospora zamorensis]|uniref:hypothetical protein n=1 Tax=Micromonospora zamorensis TaxID=709883 RepID=UPI0033EDA317
MTDLDERIVLTLREHADGSVDTDRLLAAAVGRGRTRLRRRRTAAGTALGLVAVLGVGVAIGPMGLHGSDPDYVPPGLGRPTDAVVAAMPPRADGVAGAADRPDLVGADAGLLHFGFAPNGPRYLNWSVRDGVESAELDVGGRTVTLELAASADVLRRGAQGVLAMVPELSRNGVFDGSVSRDDGLNGVPIWLRHWQPAPGVYARAGVVAKDQRDLFDVAAALRLDQAYRCGGPLRLTALPPGTQITGCEAWVGELPGRLAVALMVARASAPGIRVNLDHTIGVAESRNKGNRTIGGKPVYRSPQGDYLELLGLSGASRLSVDFGWPAQGYTEEDAATVLSGAQVAEHLDRPDTW